jgi:hypothetical protein
MQITNGVMTENLCASKGAKIPARFGAGVAVAAAAIGWAAPARAAVTAFSLQQTSGYSLTGGALGLFSPNTSTSAAQTAVPSTFEAHSGLADALESYAGPLAGRPPENTFTKKGQTTPDYSRGDTLINIVNPASNDVAELYLTSLGNSSGSGAWSVSAPLTLTSSGSVTLGFSFNNELQVINDGGGTAQAKYSYNISIQDANGVTVFDNSPTVVNRSMSLATAGAFDVVSSGSAAVTSGTLPVGTYVITLSGNESVFGNLTVVPEPAALSVIALGCVGLLGRRRR